VPQIPARPGRAASARTSKWSSQRRVTRPSDSVIVDWRGSTGQVSAASPARCAESARRCQVHVSQQVLGLSAYTPQDGLFRRNTARSAMDACASKSRWISPSSCFAACRMGSRQDSRGHVVGETQTVHLPEPIPTHLVYWTAWVDDEGRVQFRDDIYQLDAAAHERCAGCSLGPAAQWNLATRSSVSSETRCEDVTCPIRCARARKRPKVRSWFH
jgi:hypothetical protein